MNKNWIIYLLIAVSSFSMAIIGITYKPQSSVVFIPHIIGGAVFFIMFIKELWSSYNQWKNRYNQVREEIAWAISKLLTSNNDLEKAALKDMITMREKYLKWRI